MKKRKMLKTVSLTDDENSEADDELDDLPLVDGTM